LDKNNVEKAIITTVNRAASSKIYTNDDVSDKSGHTESDPVKKAFENLRVIDLSNRDPERFYKFFWFNPKIDFEQEEHNYKILESHFEKGFCGVKIHSGIHFVKIPRDTMKLVSFMQDFNKKYPLFIHFTPKFSAFGGRRDK